MDDLYKGAKTSAEKVKLARQLMSVAESSQKADERFVIRRKAAELASDAGQTAVMRQAIEAIAAEFKIDALMVEAKMLERQKAIDGADEFLRRAVVEDRYDAALIVVNHWRQKAPARDRKEVHRRQKEIERLQDQWLEASVAVRSLEGAFDDPSGNLEGGPLAVVPKGRRKGRAFSSREGKRRGAEAVGPGGNRGTACGIRRRLKIGRRLVGACEKQKGRGKGPPDARCGGVVRGREPHDSRRTDESPYRETVGTNGPVEAFLGEIADPLPFGTCVKAGRDFPIGRWTDLLASADVNAMASAGIGNAMESLS